MIHMSYCHGNTVLYELHLISRGILIISWPGNSDDFGSPWVNFVKSTTSNCFVVSTNSCISSSLLWWMERSVTMPAMCSCRNIMEMLVDHKVLHYIQCMIYTRTHAHAHTHTHAHRSSTLTTLTYYTQTQLTQNLTHSPSISLLSWNTPIRALILFITSLQ